MQSLANFEFNAELGNFLVHRRLAVHFFWRLPWSGISGISITGYGAVSWAYSVSFS